MKRVLIAGATGYLGRYMVEQCKQQGYRVRALTRSVEKLAPINEAVDEVHVGEVTDPGALASLCDNVDIVFSSIGITRQKGKLTFKDVDYQGNCNLLKEAMRAGVKKFVYVSVFNGPNLLHLDIVKAHEDFVSELKNSGIDFSVVRPTGYFSDTSEFLTMARKGRVYLVGSGEHRMNPIHGADLAQVCVTAFAEGRCEVDVGGPQVFNYREICRLAFGAIGKPTRIWHVPVWLMNATVRLTRLFNRHQGELLAFFTAMMTNDVVAPQTGSRQLQDYFQQLGEKVE